MIELLRLATFAVFLGLGAWVAFARTRRRRAVQLLILYVLGIHGAVVLTGRDDWPFTGYPLIQKRSRGDEVYREIVFYGVDARGREWEVDPRAWQPASRPVLMQWFVTVFPRLDTAQRERAGAFLLAKAEQARTRKRGFTLAAPDWWDYTVPPRAPSPFVTLRVYEERFKPRDRMRGAPADARTLLLEAR